MKKSIVYGIAMMAVLGFGISCNKDELTTPASPASTGNNLSSARVAVTRFEQDESFENPCCGNGEVINAHYTVLLVDKGNGNYQASLNNLVGVGETTGTVYHGANTQGVQAGTNPFTYHFSTIYAGGGCVFSISYIFHVTTNALGETTVVKDQLSIECRGN